MNKKSFTMADRRSSRFHISEIVSIAFTMCATHVNRLYLQRIAFTMAEILLSLTIIGVVAAITLPSLTGNINERTWEAQRKAFYARMSQAMALMGNINGYGQYVGTYNNGSASVTADTAAMAFITDGLSKVLKINNICDNQHFGDCGIPDKYTKMFGSSKTNFPKKLHKFKLTLSYSNNPQNNINTNAVAFETQNGESVITYYNPFCVGHNVVFPETHFASWREAHYYNPYFCATFVFDLNGKKGPNKVGKDIWFMSTLYSDRAETTMFEPNRISKELTDTSYNANATIQFCAEHNARLATIGEGMVALYNADFSGFSFGYMKDYETNKTISSNNEYGIIYEYTSTSVPTRCLYRD